MKCMRPEILVIGMITGIVLIGVGNVLNDATYWIVADAYIAVVLAVGSYYLIRHRRSIP